MSIVGHTCDCGASRTVTAAKALNDNRMRRLDMDRVPAEICGEIYGFACVDDGRTGRALSLVSRFVHETSKAYKLQSIAVIGQTQLFAFADLIEHTPIHLRRVDCIFLSAHSRHTASDPRALSPEYVRKQDVYYALERILRAISSCVRIIHAFFVFIRPFALLPVSLPALEELVIHGPMDISIDVDHSIQFTALKHLNLTTPCHPAVLLDKVLQLTPSLVTLCITASDRSSLHAIGWSAIIKSSFPTHLRRILIHVPTKPKGEFVETLGVYNRIMLALRVLADSDQRVTLLLPIQLHLFSMVSIQDAEATWNVSAAGIPWW